MNSKQIIKIIMNLRELSQEKLAVMAGFESQSNITGILNRGTHDMRVDQLVKLAEAMDCEVIVREKNGSNSWIVGDDSETDNIIENGIFEGINKMKFRDAIREILSHKSITQSGLAKTLGVAQTTLAARLSQENISLKTLRETLKPLGYKVVIMPETATLPDDSCEIE